MSLDEKDILILEILQADGRASIADLGRRIGLSQPATYERVRKLEDAGVISGYAAQVSAKALGLRTMAIIRLRTAAENVKACIETFAQTPNVVEAHRVTGEDCFIIKALTTDPEALEAIIDRVARFGTVTTSVVLRSEPQQPIGKALLSTAKGGNSRV